MTSARYGTYKLKTSPATEPLSTVEVTQHLRIVSPSTAETSLLERLIKSARQHAEKHLNRSLISQTWNLYFDKFPEYIYIFKSPIASIGSIEYYDDDNVLQTLDEDVYDADLIAEPSRIIEALGYYYPSTYDRSNAVNIEFVAGYGDAAAVPEEIKIGMLLYITHLYEHRGDEGYRPPKAIYDLWNDYRVHSL